MPVKPSPRPNGKPRQAVVAGHLGELLQGRQGPDGPVVLVTLPCPVLDARVTMVPGAFHLHQPGAKVLSRAQVAVFLGCLGVPVAGRFVLRLDAPPGGGAGASTAALVALARAAGVSDPMRIARACIVAEGASDPLMFRAPERVVWASREGRVVAHAPALPAMEVLGGFAGPGLRTRARDMGFADVSDLLAGWNDACRTLAGVARIARLSAQRNLALRGPLGDQTENLARDLAAAGFAIAHTGSARALIFASGTVPQGAQGVLRAAGWRGLVQYRIGGIDA